ncbi:MAG: ABC transporter permease [Gaiellales bacterium]|nr:ABC transporter permease [Gaiellales bacterium]
MATEDPLRSKVLTGSQVGELSAGTTFVATAERPIDASGKVKGRFSLGPRANRVLGLLSPLLIVALWETASQTGVVDARFFPPPTEIAETFWHMLTHDAQGTPLPFLNMLTESVLMKDLWVSLSRIIVGFFLGAVPGLIIGLSMGLFRPVRLLLRPIVSATYPIPKLALLPLVMVLFGLGETSKYVIIALGTFFMVLINTMAGVLNLEKIYLDVAKNFGASRTDFYTRVAFPGAMPLIFTGLELGMGMALLLIVAAEMNGAAEGIGARVWMSYAIYNLREMYVAFILIAALGYLFAEGLAALERKVVPWKPQ